MEGVLDARASVRTGRAGRNAPFGWLKNSFSHNFWLYFGAVFFFDAGYGVYFFLLNLYLHDRGFSEGLMGWVGGAMAIGSLLVMIPAGVLSRKTGLKALIVACFIVSPLLNAARVIYMGRLWQIGLAVVAGMAMSLGTVCYLPAVARLTTDNNRTTAFSLIISASLVTSALGGVICGYLPRWATSAGLQLDPGDLKRAILLGSCLVVSIGLLPLMRLQIPEPETQSSESLWQSLRQVRLSPFLVRFLPLTALWAVVLASFTPFANVYLASKLHVPMNRIGLVFSSVQIIQLCMGLAAPSVFRAFGLARGIIALQGAAGVMFCALALARSSSLAITAYIIVSALQWMSSPGLYNLVMSKTVDGDRNTVAAATLFSNSIAASFATTCSGMLLVWYGYSAVLLGVAALAFAAALLVSLLLTSPANQEAAGPARVSSNEG